MEKQRDNTAKPSGRRRGNPDKVKPFRWKKGQCPNPKGRPPGEPLTTKIRRVLNEPDEEHGTKADKLIAMAVQYAEGGDFRYFKEIIDRIDGKVPDRIANADGTNIELVDRPSWEKV